MSCKSEAPTPDTTQSAHDPALSNANSTAQAERATPPAPAPAPQAMVFVEWKPNEVGMEDWLQITALTTQERAGWATGRTDKAENRVEIQTEGVSRIKLDLARINLDWSRRVWIRIDDQSAELVRGQSAIKELELSDAGRWVPVRGSEPIPATP